MFPEELPSYLKIRSKDRKQPSKWSKYLMRLISQRKSYRRSEKTIVFFKLYFFFKKEKDYI